MTTVTLTFGERYYFLCPLCGRRCEAIYDTYQVGCRKCLRLGYLSQSRRRSSAWYQLDRLYSREMPFSNRYFPTNEAEAVVKELAHYLRDEIQSLVEQVEVKAAE